MRDYQRTRNNKYVLPTPVYHQTIWLIRDYARMVEQMDDILLSTHTPLVGIPRGNRSYGVSETVIKAEKRETLRKKTAAIEAALETIPEEYRKPIWDNIQERKAYPLYADKNTFGRWKSRLIYRVAVNAELYIEY